MGFFYEYALSNILKRYQHYQIDYKEYIESFNQFNKLCECYSSSFNKKLEETNYTWIERVYNVIGTNSFAKSNNMYKKSELFEILLILYISKGYREINTFSDFIEKWFKDGILILITDQGDEVKEEMKKRFFNKKSYYMYILNSKSNRYIFEIEEDTGKIDISIFSSYYHYFELNRALDDTAKSLESDSTFDALKYSYESQPIAKCQWVSRKKEGVEIGMKALSREDFHKVFGKSNPVFASTRLFTDMYEKERNTKRLIRKNTGMSNKKYKEFLNDIKRGVYRSDLQSEILIAKLSKISSLPVDNYTVSIAMRWLNIGRGWNISHIKVTDLLDAIIEIQEKNDA